MKPILVLYATRHGLARRVAERLADRLRAGHETAEVLDCAQTPPESMNLDDFAAALLVTSVHAGRVQPEMVAFAAYHHHPLAKLPTAFFAVSMTAAGAANQTLPAATREKKYALALKTLDQLARDSGWSPRRVHLVAGALPYTKYGFWLRQVMRFMAWMGGSTTDTSRDHEFTDWAQIDRAADEMLAKLTLRPAA
jgi:menaquinone-dependent protoporphyrinogen oxidase